MLTIKPRFVLGAAFYDVMMDDECLFTFTARSEALKAVAYLNATEGY